MLSISPPQIGGRQLVAAGVREGFHGTHDFGHALDAVQRALDGGGQSLARVFEIRVHLRLGQLLQLGAAERSALAVLGRGLELLEQPHQIAHRALDEVQVVADELHGRVDLVRDARGKLADGPELLRLEQAFLELALLGDVAHDAYRLVVAAAHDADLVVGARYRRPSRWRCAASWCCAARWRRR